MIGGGRSKKPYHEAAIFAVNLVIDLVEDNVNVVLTIARNETNINNSEISDDLVRFIERLKHPRVKVIVENSGKVR